VRNLGREKGIYAFDRPVRMRFVSRGGGGGGASNPFLNWGGKPSQKKGDIKEKSFEVVKSLNDGRGRSTPTSKRKC